VPGGSRRRTFRSVGALAPTPSNADGGAEEGAERNATAAFAALPRGPDLSLARDLEIHGAQQRRPPTMTAGKCWLRGSAVALGSAIVAPIGDALQQ
jgi:hypothetical protein